MAELVDTAVDDLGKDGVVLIDVVDPSGGADPRTGKGGARLRVCNTGRGMSADGLHDMMSLGYCRKRGGSAPIGMYGGGFQVC